MAKCDDDLRRPFASPEHVRSVLSDMYGLRMNDVKEMVSFEDRNYRVLTEKHMFVLKIMNSFESRKPKKIQTQISVMNVLLDDGFLCPRHLPDQYGRLLWLKEFPVGKADGPKKDCLVRLLTYIPGQTFGSNKDWFCPSMYRKTGLLLACLHETLKAFPSSDLEVDPENEWVAENAALLRNFMSVIKDERLCEEVNAIIDKLVCGIEQNSKTMDRGVIHGDFHDFNLIVDPATVDVNATEVGTIKKMFGIIDFNDLCYTYRIFEVGRLIADEMTSCEFEEKEGLEIGGHVMSGYLSIREVCVTDMNMLYDSVRFVLAQYIVLGEHAFSEQPENPYTRLGSDGARRWLKSMLNNSQSEVQAIWGSVLKEYGINRPEWNMD